MKYISIVIVFCFSIFLISGVYGQKKDKIKLERANTLKGGTFSGKKINKFIGNVIFSQQGALLYCDSAYQYQRQNTIEAFGNVRIVQGDSINLSGDRLTYNGDTRKAVMTGNVQLRDKTMTLRTKYLEYNLKSKLAYYINGGTIQDDQTTLTSDFGYYSTDAKQFRFKKNVKVVNPVKKYTLTSDTLHYNSITKIATFKGPTRIESEDGIIDADVGEYNTVTAQSNFKVGERGKAEVQSGDYTISGDHLSYDEKAKVGVVKNNVRLVSEKDKIIITGDMANYWGSAGISKVYGNVLMKSLVKDDTLFLTADTLISIQDKKDPSKNRLLAYFNTKIYKSDLQGQCDSLAYNLADSTINFFRDPVLWSDENQITADSIQIVLVNNEINTMNLRVNSFIISQDTLIDYNQIKGRNMQAHFKEGAIYQVDVDGNGESIYFALEKDTIQTGMNKVACSNMIIKMQNNKVNTISFKQKPDGSFAPPHLIKGPEKRLKGFQWREKERPQLVNLLKGKSKN